MEQCYCRLTEMLPYTPINAVGYNYNLSLSLDEFQKTSICKIIQPQMVDVYTNNVQTFSALKDGAQRSFTIIVKTDGAEIRSNFNYVNPKDLPPVGTAFGMIKTELKHFVGNELRIE
jgi:hypothetical protein